MFEYINGWEWLPIVLFTFTGFLMIQFVKDIEMTWLGVIVLTMIMFIAYDTSANNQAKAFVLQRFNEGQAIECGAWRGESTLINPHNGWKYVPHLGFVKGDQIHNDLGVCNVIAQNAPEPSVVPYGFALAFELMIVFGLRMPIQKALSDEEENHEPEPE
jgi:hypothetical protein